MRQRPVRASLAAQRTIMGRMVRASRTWFGCSVNDLLTVG
jgi:hypothetical protein